MALPAFLANLVPPSRKARRISVQSLLYAVADGLFATGSAVYFTQVVGLRASQVGLGMTLGLVAAFLTAYPAGRLADAMGPKRLWALATFGVALAFALWPFVHSFPAYLGVAILFEVAHSAQNAGRQPYMFGILEERERVETQAFLYSAINVGFTLGALAGGVALAFDDLDLLRVMPWASAALMTANAIAIIRLRYPMLDVPSDEVAEAVHDRSPRGPLRNPGYMLTSFLGGVVGTHQVLLHVVIPLWLVTETDSPRWLLAWLFGTNTVLCVFLPAFVARGVRSLADARRRIGWATAFFVLSCVITLTTHSTAGLVTAVLVWLGHVAVTGAELAHSSATWQFQAALMDPARRGEYAGVQEFCQILGYCWTPALYTWLAMEWGAPGWLVIAGIVVAAGAGMRPSSRAAERFAARRFPRPASTSG